MTNDYGLWVQSCKNLKCLTLQVLSNISSFADVLRMSSMCSGVIKMDLTVIDEDCLPGSIHTMVSCCSALSALKITRRNKWTHQSQGVKTSDCIMNLNIVPGTQSQADVAALSLLLEVMFKCQ